MYRSSQTSTSVPQKLTLSVAVSSVSGYMWSSVYCLRASCSGDTQNQVSVFIMESTGRSVCLSVCLDLLCSLTVCLIHAERCAHSSKIKCLKQKFSKIIQAAGLFWCLLSVSGSSLNYLACPDLYHSLSLTLPK